MAVSKGPADVANVSDYANVADVADVVANRL
jgi:hypothetical protein